MKGALLRYRVMAYVTGVGLIVLCCIGVPLRYAGGNDTVVAIVGPAHGVFYILYLLASLELAVRGRWRLDRLILVMAAGTIPFMSFVAERNVTAYVARRDARSTTRTTSGSARPRT